MHQVELVAHQMRPVAPPHHFLLLKLARPVADLHLLVGPETVVDLLSPTRHYPYLAHSAFLFLFLSRRPTQGGRLDQIRALLAHPTPNHESTGSSPSTLRWTTRLLDLYRCVGCTVHLVGSDRDGVPLVPGTVQHWAPHYWRLRSQKLLSQFSECLA